MDEVVTWRAPWVGFEPHPVDGAEVEAIVERLRGLRLDRAAICTSYHQSPLPLALLLRLAGVPEVAAVSEDFPGTLLDHRHRLRPDLHEVQQNLALVAALGFALPPGDDGRLRVGALGPPPDDLPPGRYVVVHPSASVPARALPDALTGPLVDELLAAGWRVVVTGADGDPWPAARPGLHSAIGRTTFASLGAVLAGAAALVCGNTGPAHLAAAVGHAGRGGFRPGRPLGPLEAVGGADHRHRPTGRGLRRLPGPVVPLRGTAVPDAGHARGRRPGRRRARGAGQRPRGRAGSAAGRRSGPAIGTGPAAPWVGPDELAGRGPRAAGAGGRR